MHVGVCVYVAVEVEYRRCVTADGVVALMVLVMYLKKCSLFFCLRRGGSGGVLLMCNRLRCCGVDGIDVVVCLRRGGSGGVLLMCNSRQCCGVDGID